MRFIIVLTIVSAALYCQGEVKVKSLKPRYTSQMTVAGYAGESTLENFPVPVRISEDAIEGFDYSKCDGQGDITFTDAAGTVLPHEIEVWNTEGESVAWVSVPALTQGATFNMNWAHQKKLETVQSQEVWTAANYSAVWHMNVENGAVKDSTGNGLGFTTSGTSSSTAKTGNSVMRSPGKTDVTSVFAKKPFSSGVSKGGMISGWGNWKGYTSGASTAALFCFELNSSSGRYFRLRTYKSIFKVNYTTSAQYNFGVHAGQIGWFHWAVNFKPGASTEDDWTHEWWLNGEKLYTTSRDYDYIVAGTTFTVKAGGTAGYTDECRVRTVSATDDWVKAEYDSVNNTQFITASVATRNSYGISIIVR